MKNQSAKQIYLSIIQTPRSLWPGVIDKLNDNVRKELLELLECKLAVTTEDFNPKRKRRRTTGSRQKANSNNKIVSENYTEIDFSTESHTDEPINNDSIPQTRRRRKKLEDPLVLPSLYGNSNDKQINNNNNDALMLSNTNILIHPPLYEFSLPCLSSLMYVAGDDTLTSVELLNERLIHLYLNFWMSLVLTKINSNLVNTSTAQANNPLPSSSKLKSPTAKLSLNAFKEVFPIEVNEYNNKIILHKQVSKQLSQITNTATDYDENEESNKNHEPDINKASMFFPLDDTEEHKDITTEENSTRITLVQELIISKNRFSQDRLLFQNKRTESMTSDEYKVFSKAREQTFRACTKVFTSWIESLLKHVSMPKNAFFLSASLIRFLNFLVTDRIFCIVELALRIQTCISVRPTSETSVLERVEPDDPEIPLLGTMSNHDQKDSNDSDYSEDSEDIGRFSARAIADLQRLSKLTDVASASQKKIAHENYRKSIKLMLRYIDVNIVSSISNSKDNMVRLDDVFLKSATALYGSVSEGQGNDLQDNVAKKRLERKSAGKLEDSENENNKMKKNMGENDHDVKKNSHSSTMEESQKVPMDTNIMFTQLLTAALQQTEALLSIPKEEYVFAYLCCRELFWDFRFESLSKVWPLVEERYQALRESPVQYQVFQEKYKKIVGYSEIIHKVFALGEFLVEQRDSAVE